MKKLIQGILDFRKHCLKDYLKSYSHLHKGQAPDYLLVTCSDSRVAPNIFASTNPGDVFAIRNVGNIITPYDRKKNIAEGAAIDFALNCLPVKDIIICGHSDCGAMRAIVSGMKKIPYLHLKNWLACSGCPEKRLRTSPLKKYPKEKQNHLAQLNVLTQIENVKSYPIVQERLFEKKLNIHGWYFDLANGSVYSYEKEFEEFILIDQKEAKRILKRLRNIF